MLTRGAVLASVGLLSCLSFMLLASSYSLVLDYFYAARLLSPMYVYAVMLVLVIPVVEEVVKLRVSWLDRRRWLGVVVAAYSFQLVEAIWFAGAGEHMWWLRLLLPLHVLFSLVCFRYGLWLGIGLHMVWNMQQYLDPWVRLLIWPANYLLLVLVTYQILSDRNVPQGTLSQNK